MIPSNEEHMEALQQEVNHEKDAQIAKMTPAEQAKMKAIEEAVAILQAAQVRYSLHASPDINVADLSFWQFRKLSYQTDWAKRTKETSDVFAEYVHSMLILATSAYRNYSIVMTNPEAQPLIVYNNGVAYEADKEGEE